MSDPIIQGSQQLTPEEVLSEALIEARKGKEEGFTKLWRYYNSRLTRFVQIKVLGSSIEAEEIVSETWLNVAKDLRKFEGGVPEFAAWLYTIAKYRIIDAVRVRNKQVRPTENLDKAFWLASSVNIEKDFDGSQGIRRIIEKIQKLPPAQAEVIMLRVISDLSVAETAKIVKKNENAVRVLAHRGMITLKESLGGEYETQ